MLAVAVGALVLERNNATRAELETMRRTPATSGPATIEMKRAHQFGQPEATRSQMALNLEPIGAQDSVRPC